MDLKLRCNFWSIWGLGQQITILTPGRDQCTAEAFLKPVLKGNDYKLNRTSGFKVKISKKAECLFRPELKGTEG